MVRENKINGGNFLDHVECDLASAYQELLDTNDAIRKKMGVVSAMANDRGGIASESGAENALLNNQEAKAL